MTGIFKLMKVGIKQTAVATEVMVAEAEEIEVVDTMEDEEDQIPATEDMIQASIP